MDATEIRGLSQQEQREIPFFGDAPSARGAPAS